LGEIVDLTLRWDGHEISVRAEVLRRYGRSDKRQELSLRFVGLSEGTQDAIRRRVFATQRDLRARGLI